MLTLDQASVHFDNFSIARHDLSLLVRPEQLRDSAPVTLRRQVLVRVVFLLILLQVGENRRHRLLLPVWLLICEQAFLVKFLQDVFAVVSLLGRRGLLAGI